MKYVNRLFLMVVLLSASTVPAFASGRTFALDPYHTQVHVSWSHMGFSRPSASLRIDKGVLIWNGVDPGQSFVSVTIPVASIDTSVPALNASLKSNLLDAKKYPVATFKSINVERVRQMDVYRIKGLLTLHGITRLVTMAATLNKYGDNPVLHTATIGFNAVLTIRRSRFGLGQGIPLAGDKVQIHVTAEAVPPEALAMEKRPCRRWWRACNREVPARAERPMRGRVRESDRRQPACAGGRSVAGFLRKPARPGIESKAGCRPAWWS